MVPAPSDRAEKQRVVNQLTQLLEKKQMIQQGINRLGPEWQEVKSALNDVDAKLLVAIHRARQIQ